MEQTLQIPEIVEPEQGPAKAILVSKNGNVTYIPHILTPINWVDQSLLDMQFPRMSAEVTQYITKFYVSDENKKTPENIEKKVYDSKEEDFDFENQIYNVSKEEDDSDSEYEVHCMDMDYVDCIYPNYFGFSSNYNPQVHYDSSDWISQEDLEKIFSRKEQKEEYEEYIPSSLEEAEQLGFGFSITDYNLQEQPDELSILNHDSQEQPDEIGPA